MKRIVCTAPEAAILNRMVSLTPKTPGSWRTMSGSSAALAVLMAVIASRSDTVPSPGVRSSAVVVTVMTAGAWRHSSCSNSGLNRYKRGFMMQDSDYDAIPPGLNRHSVIPQVLFEDNHCVAVAKPGGLLTQGVPAGVV